MDAQPLLSYASVLPAPPHADLILASETLTPRQGGTALARGDVLIFPDRTCADRTIRRFGPATPLARTIAVCSHLTSSRHVVVLTEALARKYRLAPGMDPDSIYAWIAAGGSTDPFDLYDAAAAGATDLPAGDLRRAAYAEAALLDLRRREGLSAEVERYFHAEQIHGLWQALLDTDPLRRDAARLDGTVSAAAVVGRARGELHLEVSAPCKARAGKTLTLLEDGRGAGLSKDAVHKVKAVRAQSTPGQLVIVVSMRTTTPWRDGQHLDVATTQSSMPPPQVRLGRWGKVLRDRP